MSKIVLSNKKEVTLREPKVRDMLALEPVIGEQLKEVTLISNLSGLSVEEIEEITIKDYKKLSEKLQSFL